MKENRLSLSADAPETDCPQQPDSARHARRFELLINVYMALLYAHFGFALAGIVPYWTLTLSAAVLVPRWMLAVHELFHIRSERQVAWLTRLLPLALTPLVLGYREYRTIHFGHHRHMATQDDPDFFHIRGSKLTGALNALTAVDQTFFRYLAKHGADRELVIGSALRLGVFVGLIAISGAQFFWYWVPVRLAYGSSYFSFFYCLHRRGKAYGVYPLTLPRRRGANVRTACSAATCSWR